MKLLSIIIPIFNVELYVEKCIRSLLAQDISHEDYEIICVNDGSPDHSREVVLHLQKDFSNIILVDQENRGVSQARNAGIDKANGRYLLFIDPDDYIFESSLASILKEADLHRAQMVIPGYTYLDLEGNVHDTKTFRQNRGRVMTGIEAYYIMREKKQLIADSSVGIVFEGIFLKENKLRYLPNVPLNQDVELLARIHTVAERTIFVEQSLYIAAARQGSATRSNQISKENVRNGFNLAASNLKKFQRTESLKENQKKFLNGPIVQFVMLTLYSASRTKSIHYLKSTIKLLKASGLGTLKLRGCKGYHKTCGIAYNISPYLGAGVLTVYLRMENLNILSMFNRRNK